MDTGTYAYRRVGKWMIELLTDGSLMLTSEYANEVNISHHVDLDATLVNVPQYVIKAVNELRVALSAIA